MQSAENVTALNPESELLFVVLAMVPTQETGTAELSMVFQILPSRSNTANL
jgi:hypothetical protein